MLEEHDTTRPSKAFGVAANGFGVGVFQPDGDWAATFTHAAYTVSMNGPLRTFSEATAAYPVTHSTWVRTLPRPFDGDVDEAWLVNRT